MGPELVEVVDLLRPRLPGVAHYVSLEKEAPGMLFHSRLLNAFPKEEPDIEVDEDDPFIIFFTSGTTGVPAGSRLHPLSETGRGKDKGAHYRDA